MIFGFVNVVAFERFAKFNLLQISTAHMVRSVSMCLYLIILLFSLHPLILFCFVRKRQGSNSKTAGFFYCPGFT